MRHWLSTGLAAGLSALLAGCGPECTPDEGFGPNVSWGPTYTYARTGEPVTMNLHVYAQDIDNGYEVHGHCEREGADMSGTVEIVPAGGASIAGELASGSFSIDIPYPTALDLRVDTTAPERGTYTEHWLLPSVFTLGAAPSGTNVQFTWTPPAGDHGDLSLDITDVQTNNTLATMMAPDTGSLLVAGSTFTHPGEYYIAATRAHPTAPYNTLRIGATYIHP
ncbi:MAG: hypothetical protein IPQ07_41190 [Myxococcales bacterium]|nr:hypothetical protein [Myxococcales bacterium]